MSELGKFDGMKDLVDKANNLLNSADKTVKLNILVGWKNNDSTQKSNLIIPDRGTKWVEPTQYDATGAVKQATIKMKPSQQARMMEEKYPYGASNESTNSDSVILNDINHSDTSGDLPF